MVGGAIDTLVVFHDHGAFWFSKYLRNGFRHVFVVVLRNGYWVMLDGRAGLPELSVIAGEDFDLAGFYRREHGFTVLGMAAPRRRPRSPVMLGTCVGAVKRIMGIHAMWVLTPYQFYRYLKRGHG